MKHRLMSISLLLLGIVTSPVIFALESLNSVTPQIATELYNPQGNAIGGNSEGSITLVEFFDYNCPFCRDLQPTIQKLIQQNPDLRVVFKEYLLFGPPSLPATSAALAAHAQGKYLKLHDALLKASRPLDEAEVLRIAKLQGLDVQRLKLAMLSPEVQHHIIQNGIITTALNLEAAPAFIVTNTRLAKNPQASKTPQYLFVGSDGAEEELQGMIDQVRKG